MKKNCVNTIKVFLIIVIQQSTLCCQIIKHELSPTQKAMLEPMGLIIHSENSYEAVGGSPFPLTRSYTLNFNGDNDSHKIKFPFKASKIRRKFVIHGGKYFGLLFDEKSKSKTNTFHFVEFGKGGKILNVIKKKEVQFDSEPNNFYIRQSQDSSKLVVIYVFDKNDKKDGFLIDAVVYDHNINIINRFQIKDNTPKSQIHNDYEVGGVDNDGSIYLLQKISDNSNDKSETSANYKFVFHTKSLTDQKEIEVKTDNTLIYNNQLFFDPKGQPVIIQSIGAKDIKDPISIGFIMQKIDKSTNSITSKSHYFSKDELNDFGTWEKEDVDGLKFSKISPNYVYLNNNLTFYFEQFYSTVYHNTINNPKTHHGVGLNNSIIYYGSIISTGPIASFTVNDNAEVLDYMYIPKFTWSGGIEESLMIPFRNSVAYIYIDRISNMDYNIKEYKEIAGHRDGLSRKKQHLVFAYKDDLGDIVRIPIDVQGPFDVDFKNTIKLNQNTYLMSVHYYFSELRQKLALLKITID